MSGPLDDAPSRGALTARTIGRRPRRRPGRTRRRRPRLDDRSSLCRRTALLHARRDTTIRRFSCGLRRRGRDADGTRRLGDGEERSARRHCCGRDRQETNTRNENPSGPPTRKPKRTKKPNTKPIVFARESLPESVHSG